MWRHAVKTELEFNSRLLSPFDSVQDVYSHLPYVREQQQAFNKALQDAIAIGADAQLLEASGRGMYDRAQRQKAVTAAAIAGPAVRSQIIC